MNEKILEKKTVKSVLNYLQNFDPNTSIIVLDKTARSAEDAANSLNVEVGAIVKSLIFKSTNNNLYYLCLVSGDKFISLKKLSLIVNGHIEKALANEVKDQTGFSIGGVPPVAHATSPTKIFIDYNLNQFNSIFAAAGHPHAVFETNFNILKEITGGEEKNITE